MKKENAEISEIEGLPKPEAENEMVEIPAAGTDVEANLPQIEVD